MPNPTVMLALWTLYIFFHIDLLPWQHIYFSNLTFIAYHIIQAISFRKYRCLFKYQFYFWSALKILKYKMGQVELQWHRFSVNVHIPLTQLRSQQNCALQICYISHLAQAAESEAITGMSKHNSPKFFFHDFWYRCNCIILCLRFNLENNFSVRNCHCITELRRKKDGYHQLSKREWCQSHSVEVEAIMGRKG